MAEAPRKPSPAAMARAQALVPALAELIENHDPALEGLDFNQIEASAAAIGDVVSRLLMKGAVEQRPVATKYRSPQDSDQILLKEGSRP